MKVFEYRIEYKYGDTIRIKPISDVHLGHALCDVKQFKEYISDTKAYYIGVGDFLDSIITKDIKRYDKKMDATKEKGIIDYQVDKMYEMLLPIKDRIIGLGEGNHEETIRSYGTHPMNRLCEKLEVPYIGYTWFLKLILSENGARIRTVYIKGHHGWGGGSRTAGGKLTKFARDASNYDADIFLYGHVHKKHADEIPRLGIVGNKLIAKPKKICICGTFQKTLTDDADPSWAETRGFAPTAIGGLVINITPISDWVKISIQTD